MYCQKCGSKITEGSMFCSTCGTKVEEPKAQESQYQAQYQPGQAQQTQYQAQPQYQQPQAYGAKSNGYSIASLVLGIVGIIFPIFVASILAIVFANISAKSTGGEKDGMAKAGFIMGWISLGISIIVVVFAVILVGVVTTSIVANPYFWSDVPWY